MNDFTQRMKAIADPQEDPESAHIKADDLMVELLRDLGYDEAMDAYESMTKWYA